MLMGMTATDPTARPPRALSRAQSRAVDRYAIDRLGLPGLVLMENAAINATSALLDLVSAACELHPQQMRIAVCCGGGNNGGDGYAMARHLTNWGCTVDLYALKPLEALNGDARTNAAVCRAMGLMATPWDGSTRIGGGDRVTHAVVDALLGTGFEASRGLREPTDAAIAALNDMDVPVRLAVDIPSGLDCDSGEPARLADGRPLAFRATHTVTFVLPKRGFEAAVAHEYLGEVRVADIGLSDATIAAALATDGAG